MIARREHPGRPGVEVYVPLRLGEYGTWEPLGGERVFFYQPIDAALMCADEHRRRFVEIARNARVLRALCEHPDFDFSGDGVDSDIVRESARALMRLVTIEIENVDRLLSDPLEEDEIIIGTMHYDMDEESGLIEPVPESRRYVPPKPAERRKVATSSLVTQRPEAAAWVDLARRCLRVAEDGIRDGLSYLEALGGREGSAAPTDRQAAPREGARGPHGPVVAGEEQCIADHEGERDPGEVSGHDSPGDESE